MADIDDLNKKSIREIRDDLLRQDALYTSNNAENENKIKKIQSFIERLDPSGIDVLESWGINIRSILDIDFDRLTKDEDYLAMINKNVIDVAVKGLARLKGEK